MESLEAEQDMPEDQSQQTQKAGLFFPAWNPQEESPAFRGGISSPSLKKQQNPQRGKEDLTLARKSSLFLPLDAGGIWHEQGGISSPWRKVWQE